MDFCTMAIKHAKISSQISRQLGTVRAYRQSHEDIVQVACNLSEQLEDWRHQLPPYLQPRAVVNQSELPPNLNVYHAIYLHYSYWGSLISLHSTFTYPWSGMFSRDQSQSFRNQVRLSTEIVAETSRNIILATRYIHHDAGSPVW